MSSLRLALLLLVFACSQASAPRARAANSVPAPDQTPAAASQTAQDQDSPADQAVEPPVKKKQFVPAASLNEALYLASREDRHTAAYLD